MLLVAITVAACGGTDAAPGPSASENGSRSASDRSSEPVPPVPDASAWPAVPARVGEEEQAVWGHHPEGTIVLDGDRASLGAFERSLRSAGNLPYLRFPAVSMLARSSTRRRLRRGVYDMLVVVYPSRRYGWFGVWEWAADPGEADAYLNGRLAACEPPAQCVVSLPRRITLDNGTAAVSDRLRWLYVGAERDGVRACRPVGRLRRHAQRAACERRLGCCRGCLVGRRGRGTQRCPRTRGRHAFSTAPTLG